MPFLVASVVEVAATQRERERERRIGSRSTEGKKIGDGSVMLHGKQGIGWEELGVFNDNFFLVLIPFFYTNSLPSVNFSTPILFLVMSHSILLGNLLNFYWVINCGV